jgi:hypothetical protein
MPALCVKRGVSGGLPDKNVPDLQPAWSGNVQEALDRERVSEQAVRLNVLQEGEHCARVESIGKSVRSAARSVGAPGFERLSEIRLIDGLAG